MTFGPGSHRLLPPQPRGSLAVSRSIEQVGPISGERLSSDFIPPSSRRQFHFASRHSWSKTSVK